MKLLFVGTNRSGGGTESHFITLARAMQKAGHSVAALVHPESIIHQGLKDSGVTLYQGTFRNAFDPRGIVALWRACNEFKPDWMVGSFSKEYWPLALMAKLRKIKLALFKHMDYAMKPLTHRYIPRLADRFIVISNFMREQFIARGVPPERIQMLYNPLDLNHYYPDSERRQLSRARLAYGDDDVVLGFVGAFHRDKGIYQLADAVNLAMAVLPNLKMLWVGGGYQTEEFLDYLQQGKFADRHQHQPWASDVREYFAAIDMLAFPTVGKETFGRASIEGQACGVPVLCSDRGGIPETIKPNITGLLLPPGDIQAWASAIIRLANDAELRSKMRQQGPIWVAEQFSEPMITAKMTALLQTTQI